MSAETVRHSSTCIILYIMYIFSGNTPKFNGGSSNKIMAAHLQEFEGFFLLSDDNDNYIPTRKLNLNNIYINIDTDMHMTDIKNNMKGGVYV